MSRENKLPRKIDKPWGYELIFAHTDKYVGKILFVNKGHKLSLQYHKVKDETMYIYKGQAIIEIEGSDGQLVRSVVKPGNYHRIFPLSKHRLEAIEDTTVFEVSTPELDDVERIEDAYGRV